MEPEADATLVRVPNFEPRHYQLPFLQAMDSGIKRALLIHHRRAGKDLLCLNYLVKAALQRVGTYYYFFPKRELAKRVIWDGMDKRGKRFRDYIPEPIIRKSNTADLAIELHNGSRIQLLGTDKTINVGTNPIGCVFSEFALQNPQAWQYINPILRENGGWAVFNSTPRGRNHCWDLWQHVEDNPKWFAERLTILDTGILNESDLDEDRAQGMSEELIQQEYYCSWNRGIEGAYYGRLMHQAYMDGRICFVPPDPFARTYTFWDIGVGDYTTIIFAQFVGKEIHIVDHYENSGEGLQHYAAYIQRRGAERNYIYADHFAPHDIQVREFGSGARTRLEIAEELGLRFRITPDVPIHTGIEHVRGVLPLCWIDQDLKAFREHMECYHKEWKDKHQVYSDRPVHDAHSHTADAMRYLAICYQSGMVGGGMTQEMASDFERKYKRTPIH